MSFHAQSNHIVMQLLWYQLLSREHLIDLLQLHMMDFSHSSMPMYQILLKAEAGLDGLLSESVSNIASLESETRNGFGFLATTLVIRIILSQAS